MSTNLFTGAMEPCLQETCFVCSAAGLALDQTDPLLYLIGSDLMKQIGLLNDKLNNKSESRYLY